MLVLVALCVLRAAAAQPWLDAYKTGECGAFEFRDLPPGTYVFGVNLTKEPYKASQRGVPVCLPGTAVVSEATVIELKAGDKERRWHSATAGPLTSVRSARRTLATARQEASHPLRSPSDACRETVAPPSTPQSDSSSS